MQFDKNKSCCHLLLSLSIQLVRMPSKSLIGKQYWSWKWLVAWWNQTMNWTNADLLSSGSLWKRYEKNAVKTAIGNKVCKFSGDWWIHLTKENRDLCHVLWWLPKRLLYKQSRCQWFQILCYSCKILHWFCMSDGMHWLWFADFVQCENFC